MSFLVDDPPFFPDLAKTLIYGIILYSRLDMVPLVKPFLERELRVNGGVLDRIYIMVISQDGATIHGFDDLAFQYPYAVRTVPVEFNGGAGAGIKAAWMHFISECNAQKPEVIIKFDDDTVWLRRGAPGYIAREVLRERCSVVSANVVNHPVLSQLHQMMSAIMDFSPCEGGQPRAPWCFRGELSSPAYVYSGEPLGKTLHSWEYAANMHETFFRRVANDSLDAYNFNLHDFHIHGWTRWSINMIGMTRKVLNEYNGGDDEVTFSLEVPQRLNMRACAVGAALVVHYSYGPQRSGQTEHAPTILSRYAALARAIASGPTCGWQCARAALQ